MSGERGYRLATTVKDLDDAMHTAAEIVSRIEELKKRLAPLNAFKEKALVIAQYG